MKELELLKDIAHWAELFRLECGKAEVEMTFADKAERVHWENLEGRLYWAIAEWKHYVQQKRKKLPRRKAGLP